MKIQQGKQELDIELSEMHTDKRLTYWNASTKKYVPVEHSCLPISHFLICIAGRYGVPNECFWLVVKYAWLGD